MPQDAERADLRDLADLARHRAQNLNLQQLGAVACAGCAVDAREGARTAIEPRRVWAWRVHGSRAKSDEKRRTFVLVSCPTACIYIYGIYLGCCNSIYVICARCDVRIYHFKVQICLSETRTVDRVTRLPSNVFPLLCGCYVSPRPLSQSIITGWCLVMT